MPSDFPLSNVKRLLQPFSTSAVSVCQAIPGAGMRNMLACTLPMACAEMRLSIRAGRYELTAVLTHKGRSADSGHYVSWAKQDDGQWLQFDDEEMIPRKEEEVIALSGGGDWHMAYLLLYKAVKA